MASPALTTLSAVALVPTPGWGSWMTATGVAEIAQIARPPVPSGRPGSGQPVSSMRERLTWR